MTLLAGWPLTKIDSKITYEVPEKKLMGLQSGVAGHLLGFEDEDLESSPGWWATTVQPADIGWPTGNRKKLSSTKAQLGQATCLAVA